jgi:curved DNA-binding protein CbpA
VDVQSASALLGVSINTKPDEVRRAYLRKVKLHQPETDPEGFARVRDAFELLKQFQTYAQFVHSPEVLRKGEARAVPSPPAEVRVEPPSAPPCESPSEPAPEQPKTAPAPVPDESMSEEDQASDQESSGLEQRFAEVPYFDLEGKAKFFREEWDRPSAELFWFTLQKLSPYRPMRDILCECLRRAVDLEMPHALAYLVHPCRDRPWHDLFARGDVAERIAGGPTQCGRRGSDPKCGQRG